MLVNWLVDLLLVERMLDSLLDWMAWARMLWGATSMAGSTGNLMDDQMADSMAPTLGRRSDPKRMLVNWLVDLLAPRLVRRLLAQSLVDSWWAVMSSVWKLGSTLVFELLVSLSSAESLLVGSSVASSWAVML